MDKILKQVVKSTLLFILIFLNSQSFAKLREIQCKVIGINDGDTLTCLYQKSEIKVRLLYIDAPESKQPFGNKAKQALANLVFKKEVKILSTGYDKYHRLLGVIYDEKQRNINLALVEQGMAWAYYKTQPIYQQAEQKARIAKIGLWQDPNPINPADWRKNKRSHSGNNLQKNSTNKPLTNIDCSHQLSCKKIGDYDRAVQYFQQCGWKALDGNNDGIPCNKLYRKAQHK
ncbi:thermonuclease family protein [Otariodibacter oris]|uniref:Endonuclease YncB(Thermonuclease family) n=1 Tax=Otariodibacter oris TaxID=1032623 RepID=A0A420XF17_9PAST|nr:thermonuclease family protein [Otariodibacter oris]QGM81434.1 nuclease [Otariodibacter oris]RKR70751.1 endonuclease YncB(thermonuclease family) [Otariodibacter oris]